MMELRKVKINGWAFEEDGDFSCFFIERANGDYFLLEGIDLLTFKFEEAKGDESPYRLFYDEDGYIRIKVNEGDSFEEVFVLKTYFEDYDFPEYLKIAMFYLESLNVKWRRKHPEPNV